MGVLDGVLVKFPWFFWVGIGNGKLSMMASTNVLVEIVSDK